MTKKEPTAKQLAARKAASERFKKMHQDKKTINPKTVELPENNTEIVSDEPSITDLIRQITELKAAMFDSGRQETNVKQGALVGETDKYSTDKGTYTDPTPRLKEEKKLQTIAFNYNYELDYSFQITSYPNKFGINMREPRFNITLNRVVLDDQGEQTNKRYIARKLIFHEDPEAAMAIARENGLTVQSDNEQWFLDEMRYLRVRDWLFDIFWPKQANESAKVQEEVIGGQIVQVFTKSSEDSSEIDFNKLGDQKLRA